MKIAVYFDLPNGGAFRTMEEVLKRLKERHSITLFTDPIPTNSKFRPYIDFFSLVIARLKQKQLASQINRGDYDLVFVTHDRHLQAPWILRYLKKPSVFLCQEPTRSFFEQFLAVDENLPLPNKLYEKLNRFLRKTAEIKNAQFATKIIANSNYSVESIFRAYGVSSTTVHLGVDTNTFKPKTKSLKYLTVVGNDEPQKALSFAIEVLKNINPKIRPTLAILCPRQNNLENIRKLAKKLDIKIKFLVGLTPAEMAEIYNQSYATLAVAYLEPFGLSVVESLACGTPVVAVNEGGFRETVIDKVNGLLSERNPAPFASLVEKIIEDKNLRSQFAENGRDSAIKNFTWEKTISKIEQVFHEVI